jgi:hypothetical protein
LDRRETDEQEIARISGAHELGLVFFRTIILLNGGAFVVLMTYLGGAKSDAAFLVSLEAIRFAMKAFLVALGAMLLALLISYLYTAMNHAVKLKKFLDSALIPLNVILSVIAIAAFVCGVLTLLNGTNSNI